MRIRELMTSDSFDELNERNLAKFLSLNPDCATIFGRHDPYDRHMPDGSFRRIEGSLDLLATWCREAETVASREDLSHDQLVSLDVLRYTEASYRFSVEDYPLWRMRPEALENPGAAFLMMLVREYAPLPERLESMAHRIGEIPRYLEEFRGRFQGRRPVRIWTECALDSCRGFGATLETVLKLAERETTGATRATMARNVALASEEVASHEIWLSDIMDDAVDNFAMGEERYAKMLRIRGIGLTPGELLVMAEESLAEFRSKRGQVAGRLTESGKVEDARKVVESNGPADMDEVLRRTEDAVERAKEFIVANDMMTIPQDSKVHVMMTPDFLEGATPTAATYLPAVFEKSPETVYLVTAMRDPHRMRSTWNYAAIESTAVHEAYPGHHHQGEMSNAKPWMHQLPHITYSTDTLSPPYESQEGWATYSEELMHERGFLGTDMHAFSMLDYAIWTACRVLNEVKLFCGLATVDEMVDNMVRETGCPRASAVTDVVGFSNMPGYGICYLLGRRSIKTLKRDLQKRQGGAFSEKRFHDVVALNGNLPYHLLEREVLAEMENH